MEKVFTNLACGGPVSVYVEDGKITRIRPIQIPSDEYRPWVIETENRVFTPPKAMRLTPMVHAERDRTYSKDRIPFPMKRVDFDPKGERNPQNRGISGYERISWDEAAQIVADEIKRIQSKYGGHAITGMTSSHHKWGVVSYKTGPFARFMNMLNYTPVYDNADSWEGWLWGAEHVYGFWWANGLPEQNDLLEDAMKNSDMIVFWSNDPDTTRGLYNGQENIIWRQWLKELGKKTVFIDPFYNYTNAFMDGTWIAPRPGTDTAVAIAIAYTWFEDDTYDHEYVFSRTSGIEEFRDYVMGIQDGIPKNCEWAENESGVPARRIRALAREWASKKVCLSAGCRGGEGGACRTAYGSEWARMMVVLQAMQGLGKPGVSIWSGTLGSPARQADIWFPGYGESTSCIAKADFAKYKTTYTNTTKQRLYRPVLPEAVIQERCEFYGHGPSHEPVSVQFEKTEYPIEGPVKMFYRYGSSFIGTMMDTNKWIKMYQSSNLEFVVNQDIWYGGETRFADIILPASGPLEQDDLGEWGSLGKGTGHSGNNWRIIVRQKKCIDPYLDSKPDYEIFRLISQKLDMEEIFTDGGKTQLDWVKSFYEMSDLNTKHIMTWEEFDNKGYCLIPQEDNYHPTPAFRWFAENRKTDIPSPMQAGEHPENLGTLTGKIEISSESLRTMRLPDDEREPVPKYIPSWEGHRSDLYKKYPLQLITPHPRYSLHTQHDSHVEWLDEIPEHRLMKDGYAWWRVRIHPDDAAERKIEDGEIVEVYNDRGSVLCAALVTERIRPGVIHCCGSSAKYDPLKPEAGATDKGGCINLLTSSRFMSKYAYAMTCNSCLCEIRKWEDA